MGLEGWEPKPTVEAEYGVKKCVATNPYSTPWIIPLSLSRMNGIIFWATIYDLVSAARSFNS